MKRSNLFLVLLVCFFSISCAPSYPKEKIIEGVKSMCEKEYNVEVDVVIEGVTMGVRLPLEGLFDTKTLQIKPEAFEKITGVMLSASRVALSSDRSIDFYTVITYDKNVPGAEVVMTRYIHDLRRFFLGDISRGEFAKRMVFDVRFNPQSIVDTWLGGFTLKDQTFDTFMCEQAKRRIIDEFNVNKLLAGKFKVVSVEGKLEDGSFKFDIDITREGLPMSELIHGKAWHDGVLELAMQKIAYVIYVYSFKDFERVEIINKFDNNTLIITKDEINSWRKRRVTID